MAAAARRAEQEAAAQRKLQVGAAALGALQGYQLGGEIGPDALYAITEAGLGDAFLDITSGAVDQIRLWRLLLRILMQTLPISSVRR